MSILGAHILIIDLHLTYNLLLTTLTSQLKRYDIDLATCNYSNPELSNEHVERLVTALCKSLVDQAGSAILRSRYYGHLKPWWTKDLTHFSKCSKAKHFVWKAAGNSRGHNALYIEYKSGSESAAMFKQAVEEYALLEEKQLRETQFCKPGLFLAYGK